MLLPAFPVPANRRLLDGPRWQEEVSVIDHLVLVERVKSSVVHADHPELGTGANRFLELEVPGARLADLQARDRGFHEINGMRIGRVDVRYLLYDQVGSARGYGAYGLDGDSDVGPGFGRYLQGEREWLVALDDVTLGHDRPNDAQCDGQHRYDADDGHCAAGQVPPAAAGWLTVGRARLGRGGYSIGSGRSGGQVAWRPVRPA